MSTKTARRVTAAPERVKRIETVLGRGVAADD
jgi:hypothetical protein